jgi:hypothetical protein
LALRVVDNDGNDRLLLGDGLCTRCQMVRQQKLREQYCKANNKSIGVRGCRVGRHIARAVAHVGVVSARARSCDVWCASDAGGATRLDAIGARRSLGGAALQRHSALAHRSAKIIKVFVFNRRRRLVMMQLAFSEAMVERQTLFHRLISRCCCCCCHCLRASVSHHCYQCCVLLAFVSIPIIVAKADFVVKQASEVCFFTRTSCARVFKPRHPLRNLDATADPPTLECEAASSCSCEACDA